MATAVKNDYHQALAEHKKDVRNLVMAGLEQIKEGKTKDFSAVCDRLEKKYNKGHSCSDKFTHRFSRLHMLVDSKAWLYRTFGL